MEGEVKSPVGRWQWSLGYNWKMEVRIWEVGIPHRNYLGMLRIRFSSEIAPTLGMNLTSCSSGTTLGSYTNQWELAFDSQSHKGWNTVVPLNCVRSPDVGGLGGQGEGGLGGKGHHLSITYSWHPLLLLPVVINNNKNAIIQVIESYHGTRHLNSHWQRPVF